MEPIEIVAADDERLQIPFTVPVKDSEPLEFSLPRYDCIDPDTYVQMMTDLEKLDADNETPAYQKRRASTLAMLRLFVTKTQYKALEKCKLAQLDDIARHWSQRSGISLGELLASAPTSTVSTVRPSNTTSSSSESEEETSAPA